MRVSQRLTRFLVGDLPTPDSSPASSPTKNAKFPSQVNNKSTLSSTIVTDLTGPSETVFLPKSNYKNHLLSIVQKYDDSDAQVDALERHQQHVVLLKTLFDALKSKLEDYELDLVKYEQSLTTQEQFLLSKTDFLDNYKVALQLKERSLISKLKELESKDMELDHIELSVEEGLRHVDTKFMKLYNDTIQPCQTYLNQLKTVLSKRSSDSLSWINNNRRVIRTRFPAEYDGYIATIREIDDISDTLNRL